MALTLSAHDQDLLAGRHGAASAFGMRLMVGFAEAMGAPALLDISGAHIDGCLYHGAVSLDFVEHVVALEGRVRVPTTLNVGSMDLIHPELYRGPPATAAAATRLMQAYEEVGCHPSYTCAPYQTLFKPGFGDQIAWAESNAIVFANSVLGARTNRYGDFLDLAAALTGRAPAYGLHLTENRRARLVYVIDAVPPDWDSERLAIAMGVILGERAGDAVAAIVGLPAETTEDDLKALGAVAASAGSVAMFHAVGLTPEASTLDAALQGFIADLTEHVSKPDLVRAIARLTTATADAPLAAVCLGTPHFSPAEFARLWPLLDGTSLRVPTYINTNRETHAHLADTGALSRLDQAGITLVVDTCTYVTSVMRAFNGAVMTNSGKWAWYAPGNLGIDVVYGSLAACIRSAAAGRVVGEAAT
jgi:predicted aconitase